MRKCSKPLTIFSHIPGNVYSLLVLIFALVIRQVDVIIDVSILEYLAARLKPQECSRIVSYNFNPSTQTTMNGKSSNEVECLRRLADWTSELKVTRGDIQVVLKNRLRQIGRDDLAARLTSPATNEEIAAGRQIAEWEFLAGHEKETIRKLMSVREFALPKIDSLSFGPPKPDPILGSHHRPENSVSKLDLASKLNFLLSLEPRKAQSSNVKQDTSNTITPEISPFLRGSTTLDSSCCSFHPVPRNFGVADEHSNRDNNEDEIKDENQTVENKSVSLSSTTIGKEIAGKNQSEEKNRLQQLSELKEDRCLKIPLSTALIFIAITMLLTCCCALLFRNRVAACINRLRGKNKKKSLSRKISVDEERGVMIPRRKRNSSVSLSKISKKRNRAPSEEVVNAGTQNSNMSVLKDDEETPTGCCKCCRKKKKKNGKKRKK